MRLSLLTAASVLVRRGSKAIAGPPVAATPLPASADVIVVGAGMAGVSAARDLTDYGLGVIVLEGRERIGGRIWTNRTWPNDPADMGAQWIQRSESNPLTALAGVLGLNTVPTDLLNILVYDDNGASLDALDTGALFGEFGVLLGEFYALRALMQGNGEPDISLQEALDLVLTGQSLTAEDLRKIYF